MRNSSVKTNNLKLKIRIALAIIIAILGTIFAVNSYAVYLPQNITADPNYVPYGMWIAKSSHRFDFSVFDEDHGDDPTEGVIIGLEDLEDNYDILCSQHGTVLKGKAASIASSQIYRKNYAYYTKAQLLALKGERLQRLYGLSASQVANTAALYNIVEGQVSYTLSRYFLDGEVQKADAEEAYILAEMELVDGQNYRNYVQEAWWNTNASDNAPITDYQSTDGYAFSQEAKEFAKYIEAAGGGFEESCKYASDKFKSADTNQYATAGEIVEIDSSFDIKYQPKWNETDVKVRYIEQEDKFIIGPYSIDYVDYYCQFGGRPAVQFAGIIDDIHDSKAPMKGMNLYANTGLLEYGTDWELLYNDTDRSSDIAEGGVYTEYPRANEDFYIVVNNEENLTKITNISVNFRYMNAYGSYQKIKGYMAVMTWHTDYEQTQEATETQPARYKAWLEFDVTFDDTQELAIGMEGATWYKYTSIVRNCGVKNAALTVQKLVVDDDDEIIDDENATFRFELKVDGAYNSDEPEYITLKNRQVANSRVYYWYEGENAPTYTIKEIRVPRGYECLTEPQTGVLSENNDENITVVFKNKLVREGSLQLIKKSEDGLLAGQQYTFDVRITSINKFEVDGEKHNAGETVVKTVTVTSDTRNIATINAKWYGNTAPTFNIEEREDINVESCTYDIQSGSFANNDTVTVTATNHAEWDHGAIKVIKTFDATNRFLTEDMVKDFKFKVKIHVDDVTLPNGNVLKYGDITVNLRYQGIVNGKYTWSYTTGSYYWPRVVGAPYYTIDEVEIPEGTDNVSINPRSGQLVAGSTSQSQVTITSEVINTLTPDNGNLVIEKFVDEENMIDKEYKFAVIIKGTFTYNGKDYIDQTVQVLKDGTLISAFKTVESGVEVTHIVANGEYLEDGITPKSVLDPYFIVEDASTGAGRTNTTYTERGGLEHLVAIKPTAQENTELGTVGSGTWTSANFTWYGDKAPRYTIEEKITGTDYKATVTPSHGKLHPGATSYVEAINRDNLPYSGYIRLIKTIDKDTADLSLDYINSLKFTFKVEVKGFKEQTITLDKDDIVYEDGKYKWVWESNAYTWEHDAATPTFTVTEIMASDMEGEYEGAGVVVQDKELEKTSVVEEKLFTDVECLNKIKPKQGKIVIQKDITNQILEGEEFNFKVWLTGKFDTTGMTYDEEKGQYYIPLKVNLANSNHAEATVTWYGDAPRYEVTEDESDVAQCQEIINGSGVLQKVTEVDTVVTVSNSPIEYNGYLKVKKELTNIDDESEVNFDNIYYFRITIGEGQEAYAQDPYIISLKAGETYTSDLITWYKKEPVKYKVEEITPDEDVATIIGLVDSQGNGGEGHTSVEGTMTTDGVTVTVLADNKMTEHTGTFKIIKSVFTDKLADEGQKFDITYTVTSTQTFEIDGTTYNPGDAYVQTVSLGDAEEANGPTVKWFGDVAPVVNVTENVPAGYINTNISNNGASLVEDETVVIEVTNKPNIVVEINLLTQLSGIVWIDKAADEKNTEASRLNSIYDNGTDELKKGVEVYVYNETTGSLATIYNGVNGQKITQPIITNDNGRWTAPAVKIEQGAKYNIVFIYDGEKYEPVEYLVSGSVADYKTPTSSRTKYNLNSFAADITSVNGRVNDEGESIDLTRASLIERLSEITGGNPMNGNGKTIGYDSQGNSLLYETGINLSEVDGESSKRIKSKVVTSYDNGIALDEFKVSASTNEIGILYLLDGVGYDQRVLDHIDIGKDINSIKYSYTYYAVYKYALNINLGLREREAEDISAVKDLVSAKATVNGTEYNYADQVNKLSLAQRLSDVKTLQISKDEDPSWNEYQIGLYATDYYYRAEVYSQNANYDEIVSSKATNAQDEMEITFEYKIALYNDGVYTTTINRVDDYANENLIITESPEYTTAGKYVGSDGEKYIKYVYDNLNITLAPGESTSITVKAKVDKGIIDGIQDALAMGEKSNVAEISSYSTQAGKIDKDSAPGNINIASYNSTGYYEDDTDKITVNIFLDTEIAQNEISGLAWEDEKKDSSNGDGIYDKNDEYVIGGLTTELVEKITTDSGKVVDAIWTTSEPLDVYGGKTLEELTGFDSTTETARAVTDPYTGELTNSENIGSYKFENVPNGTFAVRFEYGNNKLNVIDTSDVTEQEVSYVVVAEDGTESTETTRVNDAMAYDKDGNIAYAISADNNKETFTANYNEYYNGYAAAVYNGQDYKATVYNKSADNSKVDSQVLDNEARRLDVISNSEVITNYNNSVMYTANDPLADHTDLYNDYYMFADSDTVTFSYETEEDSAVFNAGFVERPVNDIVLDKQISAVRLIDNTGTTIFNAQYDVSYEVKGLMDNVSDKAVVGRAANGDVIYAKVQLSDSSIATDIMQAINKVEDKLQTNNPTGVQGFRYINIDEDILQGTTVEIDYRFTALNLGEQDYLTRGLNDTIATTTVDGEKYASAKDAIQAYAKLAKADFSGNYSYLGGFYKEGIVDDTVTDTTSRVRQIVDYVDNDAIFNRSLNTDTNRVWVNTSVAELSGNGYDSQRLVSKEITSEYQLLDSNGVNYVTESRNNLILSVDDTTLYDETSTMKNNADFEKALYTYGHDENEYPYQSSMSLVVTKTVSSEDDADTLSFENMAEIVKMENTVGRRDIATLAGDMNPTVEDIFTEALAERDSSATELVTFTPPTGIQAKTIINLQLALVVMAGLTIVAVGIVIIKKKVLK